MDMDDLAFLLGGELPTSDGADEYRNIWVVVEPDGAGLSRLSRQVLGRARELGDRLGVRVEAVVPGADVEGACQRAIELGADVVYRLDDPALAEPSGELWTAALAPLVEAKKPEILLFGFSALGQEVAPRLAQRLGTGLVADASQLDIDESERLLIATRSSFGGRSLATVTCPKARPQMASVRLNAFRDPDPERGRSGEIERVELALEAGRVQLRGTAPLPSEQPIERARVLVVGGKGLGGAEGAALLAQLAAALGGQVAGTRSAVEAGWVPAEKEISGRGATVAPELYVGVGVSGSMDHVDAMRQSRTIVAINTRADAPLMEMADYALVGDLHALIPALLETLQQARERKLAAGAR